MPLQTRRHAIPADLLMGFDKAYQNRSHGVRRVIAQATPADLVEALTFRLSEQKPPETARIPSVSVTVSVDKETVIKLDDLVERSRLPVEQVLRLLMEQFLRKREENV